jgi:glycosyltransferase involved in cell wall biosynthesis
VLKIFLDNTRSALSPHSGVGHVGLDYFLALRRHALSVDATFLYRKKDGVGEAELEFLRRRGCRPLLGYDPRLSVHLPLRGKILHSTYHKLPALRFRTRIVHVHDVWTLRDNPYQSPEFQARRAAKFRQLVERADLFTTMTETVKEDLVFETGVDPSRVFVTGYASPSDLDDDPEEAVSDADADLHIPDAPYVFALARVEARKNLEHTARAVRAIPGLRLVLVGGNGYRGAEIAREHLEPLRAEGRLIRRATVSPAVLRRLYRGALAFVSPSWEEGFGIPLLEAMGHGIPVITSNRSANAEVVAGGGALVDPGQWEETAHWLERFLAGPDLREDFCRRARERAGEFRWEDVAAALETLYRSAA